MTPEQKKANWRNAYDLHYLVHGSGITREEFAARMEMEPSLLRRMEKNKDWIPEDIMQRARTVAYDAKGEKALHERWDIRASLNPQTASSPSSSET